MKKYLALLLLFVCSSVTCQTRQRERSFVIVKAVQQRTVKVEDPFLPFEYPSLRTKYHVEKVLQGSYSGEYFYDYSDKTRRHTVYNYCLMSIEHIGDSVCGLDSQHCYDVYSGWLSRSNKPVTIEMDHVVRCIREPNLSFPGNLIYIFLELFCIRESCDIDNAIRAVFSELFQFNNSFG